MTPEANEMSPVAFGKRRAEFDAFTHRAVHPRTTVPSSVWTPDLTIKAPRPSSSSGVNNSTSTQLAASSMQLTRVMYDISSPRCGHSSDMFTSEEPVTPRADSTKISIFTPTKTASRVNSSKIYDQSSADFMDVLSVLSSVNCSRRSSDGFCVPEGRLSQGCNTPSRLSLGSGCNVFTLRSARMSTATGGIAPPSPQSLSGSVLKSPISPGRWILPGRHSVESPFKPSSPAHPRSVPLAACHKNDLPIVLPVSVISPSAILPQEAICDILPGFLSKLAPVSTSPKDMSGDNGCLDFGPRPFEDAQKIQAPSTVVGKHGQPILSASDRLRALVLVASLASEHPDLALGGHSDLTEEQIAMTYKDRVSVAFHDWLETHGKPAAA